MRFKTPSRMPFLLRLSCLVSLFVAPLAAGADWQLEDLADYGIGDQDFIKMPVVPTHHMETEQLFLAASEARVERMSMAQRVMNNRWLLDEDRYTVSASKVLRHYLRSWLIASLEARQTDERDTPQYFQAQADKPFRQFRELSNYDLRVSDNSFRLRFTYEFE